MPSRNVIFTHLPWDDDPELRNDPGRLGEVRTASGTRVLLYSEAGPLVTVGEGSGGKTALCRLLPDVLDGLPIGDSPIIPLGTSEGCTVFAVPVRGGDPVPPGTPPGAAFRDLRQVGPLLSPAEAALAARGAALLNWHRKAIFCPACGAGTRPDRGGFMRRCTDESCRTEHFPRLDPVVMTLVTRGDHCLLGRQPRFPPGFYSGFAGFIEAGETIEQASRRETREEAGVPLLSVRYVFSQPWPFPHVLTIGCIGEAGPDAEAKPDGTEIAEVRWFGRDEIATMLANAESQAIPRMPGPISLAHQLARVWLEPV